MKGALEGHEIMYYGKTEWISKKIVAAVLVFFFLKKDFIYLVKKKSELQKDGEREGKREREGEIFCLLVHFPDVCRSPGGATNSI